MTTSPDSGRRIVFTAPGTSELAHFTPGQPAAGMLLCRTLYSLISTGTETTILHGRYADDSHFARMFGFPQLQTGVQALGQVERTGADVSEFCPGDLVYLRLAHASHQVLPAADCSPVPDGIELAQACWAGLAKTAFRAAWAGEFGEDTRVLIIGAGPVGQMLLRWASALGCREIAVLDRSAARLSFAGRGGAHHLLHGDAGDLADRIGELGQGRGPPLVVDSTGNASVFRPALAVTAMFGRLILLGDTGYPGRQCLSSDLMTRGLTVQATHDSHDRDGWTQRKVDALFFDKLAAGDFPLDGLITHRFTPEQCAEAYRVADQERETAMGILFDWTAGTSTRSEMPRNGH